MTLDQTPELERLMAEERSRLHRYCARMMGSSVEGEDVVQDALAKAAEAYAAASPIERPQSWLLRIAHNTALDALRSRGRRATFGADIDLDAIADPAAAADARVAAAASLSSFVHLPAAQRSSVLLSDVLGYSLAETGEILGVSLASVKAALHRGRAGLKRIADAPPVATPPLAAAERDRLQAYADRFNARDFDALRDLLAEDVRLDLANRMRLDGRKDVSVYFTRYGANTGWRFAPAMAEGRPALLVTDTSREKTVADYVVLLDWKDGRIAAIRDFRFAPYVMDGMEVTAL
jgi:RNA polymerase sigma-70 factor (ECF subfamily)